MNSDETPAPAPDEAAALPPAEGVPEPARWRRRSVLIAGIVMALVVLVGVPALLISVLAKPGHRGAAGPPDRSASPSATPLSGPDYEKLLDTVLPGLAREFSDATSEHTGQDVAVWAEHLEGLLDGTVSALQSAVPPAAVASAHRDLVGAIQALNAAVTVAVTEAEGQQLCGGASALAEITRSDGANQVRQAVKELATADPTHPVTVPAFLPDPAPQQNRQLRNGTVIKKTGNGTNSFTVDNKFHADAVVSLAPTNTRTAAATLYIRSGSHSTVYGIPDAWYDLYVTTGEDWDGANGFTRDCTYERFTSWIQITANPRSHSAGLLTLDASGPEAPGTNTDAGSFPS